MNYAITKQNGLGKRQVIALGDAIPVDGTEYVSLIPGDRYQHSSEIITIQLDQYYQSVGTRAVPNENICLAILAGQLKKI
jgi:hypothetical protein